MPDESEKQVDLGQSLNDVEIFRTGTWNGEKVTEADLDEIAANFETVGFKPPVKLGHAEKSGDPAFGWVAAVRRVGDKLIADFSDLPDALYEAIKERRFDTVSSEIFINLKRGGKLFRRALKAVALLGAEIPAVADLKPLSQSLSRFRYEAVNAYELNYEDDDMADKPETPDVNALQDEVKQLKAQLAEKDKNSDAILKLQELQDTVKELQQQTAEAKKRERAATLKAKVEQCQIPAIRNHIAALYELAAQDDAKVVNFTVDDKTAEVKPDAVIDALVSHLNKSSAHLFQEFGGNAKRAEGVGDDPGLELDRQTQKLLSTEKELDYVSAFQQVLNDPANKELKRAYAQRSQ